jgi:hypothetical protein
VTTSPLAKKLQIKAGSRVLVLNPPEGYLERLEPLPDGVELAGAPGAAADVVHLFVRDRAELERDAATALGAVRPGGVLWASYPKQSAKVATDLTRDVGWDALAAAGWRVVSAVSIDDTWSALRFRPLAEVGR